MPHKHLLALSLALTTWTLSGCSPSAPLSSLSPQPAAPAKLTAARQTETLTIRLALNQPFRTQFASPAEVAFVKVSVTGDGIAGAITHTGAAFLPVVNGQVSATVVGIPQNAGDLRIVRAQAYAADQTLLPALVARTAYRSSSTTSLTLSLSRRDLLLADVMAALSATRSATAAQVDLTALQTRLDTLTGYTDDSGAFTTDPTRFSVTALAAQIGDDGSIPDVATLSTAALQSPSEIGFSLSTPDSLPIAERLRLLVDDPGSRAVMIPRLSASGTLVDVGPIAPGTWSARVENEAGEVLARTAVSADGSGGYTPASPMLSLSGVQQLRGETQINTFTSQYQGMAEVAMDDAGNYVVVWISTEQVGVAGVFGQRFDRFGAPQGSEFHVNTFTSGVIVETDVAMDADGDFVVTWPGYNESDTTFGVYAQRYDSSGQNLGAEIQVNSYTTNNQLAAAVAMADTGAFVISWQSKNEDGDDYGVYARRFHANGDAADLPFRVNAYTTSAQSEPTVAMDSDGDFVIAWQSNNQYDPYYGIYARRYDSQGNALSEDIHINTYTTNWQSEPDIAMDATGDFSLAWTSTNQDGSDRGIVARRFNSDGSAKGAEFAVNTITDDDQYLPEIACDQAGNLLISWTNLTSDGGVSEVVGRRYDRSGTARGEEFGLNTFTIGPQSASALAMDADGDFVAVWESFGQDDSFSGIFAQRYDHEGRAR
ncbi:MAG: hypothetical protein ACO1RX_12655 [Candidatus Sericytochromatia bacterium]